MTETAPRPRRWLKWALAASLAFNFILIGLAVGTVMRIQERTGAGGPVAAVVRALPEERKGAAREKMRLARTEYKPLREERRDARRELSEIVAASPYDGAAAAAAFARVRAAEAAMREAAHRVSLEILESLTPDERAAVARGLISPRERVRGSK